MGDNQAIVFLNEVEEFFTNQRRVAFLIFDGAGLRDGFAKYSDDQAILVPEDITVTAYEAGEFGYVDRLHRLDPFLLGLRS